MKVRKGWVVAGILAVALLPPVLCYGGAIKGDCSTCHTMHNSEQGQPVAFTLDSNGQQVTQPQAFAKLLKTDCLGCHSSGGAETIIDLGESRAPIVFNMTEPTYPPDGSTTSTLAGGNFHWLAKYGDPYGHNVYGIAGEDARFPSTLAPPGGVDRTGDCINCHYTLASAGSGCEGCHVPQHHADSSANVVSGRDQGWYRFLGSVMQKDGTTQPTGEGAVGIEDPDWEQSPLATRHNTYQGSATTYTSYLETGSIDQMCAGCHGKFHSETTAYSIWIRHPVDYAIPDAGEFTAFTNYDPLVPVARPNLSLLDENFSTINRGTDMISCLSCHRAHGSPYPAMLRWDYREWPGIDSHTQQPAINGCAVCHTSKN